MADGGGGAESAEHEEEEEWLVAFCYDEAELLAERERWMRREEEKARHEEHERAQHELWRQAQDAAIDRIRDYDPKQGGVYYTRYSFTDFTKLDLDDECMLPTCMMIH